MNSNSDSPRLSILLVEDDTSTRRFIKSALTRCFPDCQVDEAAEGNDARIILETLRYNVVLCDWDIPGMSGGDILRWMRQHPHLSRTPFIMITGFKDAEHVLQAKQYGVSDYIVKPITIDVLLKKIQNVSPDFEEKTF